MLSQDELYKQKYLLIPKILKCALWEYDIKTKKLILIRKLDGKWSDTNTQIENYRETVLSWNTTHPDDIDIFIQYCDSMDNGDDFFEYEFRGVTDQNKYEWLRYSGAAVKDENGVPVTVIGTTFNITHEKEAAIEIERRNSTDRLSGLYNSRALREHAADILSCSDPGSIHGFVMVNISNYRYLCETFGSSFSDTIVEKSSHALTDAADSSDIIGRYSQDTFILLRKDIRSRNELADLSQLIIDSFANIDVKKGQGVVVSIGTSVYPYDGNNYDSLCENTSKAVEMSKKNGINSYCSFENTFSQYMAKSAQENPEKVPEHLKKYALDTLACADGPSSAVDRILSQTCEYLNLSRAYVCVFDSVKQTPDISRIWTSDKFRITDINCIKNNWPDMQKKFYTDRIFVCCDAANCESGTSKELLSKLSVLSAVYCGIYTANKCTGYIAFEDCLGVRNWSDSIKNTLCELSQLITLALVKNTAPTCTVHSGSDNEQKYVCEADNTYSYAVDSRTYQLMYISASLSRIFPDAAPGKLCYEAFHSGSKPCSICPVFGGNVKSASPKDIYISKYNKWMRPTCSTASDRAEGDVSCITWQDISEFIISSNEFDPWTNVYTYARFACEADKILGSENPEDHVIVYTQINNYSDLISEYGFNVIKNIVRLFAGEMSVTLKRNEIMCRIHDSEFAVFLSYKDKTGFFTRICMTINSIISAVNDRYNRVGPKISLGYYYLEASDISVTSCIDKARTAMKSLTGFISPSPYQSAEYDERMRKTEDRNSMFEANMAEGLANGEFKVFLQPKLDIMTGVITGAEAHVRWLTEDGECYYPSEFLETFEHNGYMFEIEMYIYKKLFRKLREWLDSGKNIQRISINVSQCTLLENNFVQCIEKLVSLYRIPRNFIEIEIPERLILPNISKLLVITDSLKSKGYRLTLDNFGTGPSSMKLIRLLPFDVIKLDRQLFTDYNIDDTLPIIREALEVTRKYNKDLVAVGVEKNEHALVLKDIGCKYVQGYMYYYPMTFDDFEKNILSDK